MSDTKFVLSNSLAATGKGLPPIKTESRKQKAEMGKPAEAGVPGNLQLATSNVQPPAQRQNWLGPRYEPPNLSAAATVTDIQTAIRSAENGDTTLLFRFYRDALLGDDHIQGELSKRKLAVIGQPLAIVPEDAENADDVKAAAACTRAIADCENWSTGVASLLNASLWPVAIAENIFAPATGRPVRYDLASTKDYSEAGDEIHDEEAEAEEDSSANIQAPEKLQGPNSKAGKVSRFTFPLAYTLKRIEPVNPMLFCFRHAYLVGGVGLGTATPVQQIGVESRKQKAESRNGTGTKAAGATPDNPNWWAIDLDDWEPFLRLWPIDEQGRILYDASRAAKLEPSRHIVHRGHLLTDQKDNWGGPMRAILMLWLMRGLGREWFGRFMERYGMPFPVGKTDAQDQQAVDLLKTAFSLATKIGGLVIGQDDAVELAAANVQGGAEGHRMWVTLCNDAISFAITGIKPSDSPAGLNAGQNQQVATIREDLRILDQKLLGEVLVKQLFRRFLDFNGLPGQVRTVWGGLSENDALVFANLVKTLGEAGFEPTDDAVPGIQEKVGFEVQRKQIPSANIQAPDPKAESRKVRAGLAKAEMGGDLETLGVRRMGKLVYFSAGGGTKPAKAGAPHATDRVADERRAALGRAYRGAMAPFREIILASDSREECLKLLSAAYRDWDPGRLATELDEALQMCAAEGAVAATES